MTRGPVKVRTRFSLHNVRDLEILQINVDRKRITHDLVQSVVNRDNIDVCIISEPNKKISERLKYLTDKRCDAAIVVANRDVVVRGHGGGSGFVWAELDGIVLYGCYVSPNIAMDNFESYLLNLGNDIRKHQKPVVLAGDLNAKSAAWGSPKDDKRGDALAEWLTERDMIILNKGNKPTFVRGGQESFIDITSCDEKLAPYIAEWRVTDEETLGCHQMVRYKISAAMGKPVNTEKPVGGWRYAEGRTDIFAQNMKTCIEHQMKRGVDLDENALTQTITKACDLTYTRKEAGVRGRRAVYWWNAEIGRIRTECIRLKRNLTRTNKKKESTAEQRACAQVAYRRMRLELKINILNAKKHAWKNLIEQLDSDIWGKGYKIVTKKFGLTKNNKITIDDQLKQARKLFPNVPEIRWKAIKSHGGDEEPPPLISSVELEEAGRRIKCGKSPGPDLIPPDVVKIVVQKHGAILMRMYNNIIHKGAYPECWKRARLVLVEKPKKEGTSVGMAAYRPICLIDVLGKVLETILVMRLTREMEDRAPLSEMQHGFRKGRSAVDAMQQVTKIVKKITEKAAQHKGVCALITLDIENAFNTARWDNIVKELERKKISSYLIRIIKSYLTNRAVVIGGTVTLRTTCGVPQGSVLGPLLWNVQYDGVFGVDVPQGVELVGYADDLAVLVTGKGRHELQAKADIALSEIIKWMESKELRVAPHKTEVVVLAGRRKVKEMEITVKNTKIKSKTAIKYLGVTFGKDLSFSEHIKVTANRANETAARLARIMPSIGGPRASRRKLLYATVKSILMYAAPVWRKAMDKAVHRKHYEKVHRRMLLGVCAAYRTVSMAAVEVIAGIAPIDLQVEERAESYNKNKEHREEAKNDTMEKWQKRWNHLREVGQWTKRLIPNIEIWTSRKHGEVNHHITQVLSGHGCFRQYLHRFKLIDTDLCVYCKSGADTAEHTMYHCDKWRKDRADVENKINTKLTPENMVNIMVGSEENWQTIAGYIHLVIDAKLKDERATQKQDRQRNQ